MKHKTHIRIVLEEMCKRVHADIDKLDFKKEGWFHKYAWTQEEEIKFKAWLVQYMKKNRGARVEMMTHPGYGTTKAYLEKFVDQFVFNYGWIYSDQK
jgi:hypothetical protein